MKRVGKLPELFFLPFRYLMWGGDTIKALQARLCFNLVFKSGRGIIFGAYKKHCLSDFAPV